jgi:BirA family biotin operon repressor/biotin-[acetyl-CoA-carboxylase] ligase
MSEAADATAVQQTRREVLTALAEEPVSGPDLADDLGLSRAAVWKHVEALRAAGFEIESGSDRGYRLVEVPEFGGAAVEFGLDAPYEVEFHESLPSTNSRARELAAAGRENVAVVADEQTGGRGRLDRTWVSPSGGVWLSLLLCPEVPPAHAPLFTLAAAVATARAVRETGVETAIKWPNDVLVAGNGTKLAGVLTEMEGEADRVSWLVVGVGINANVDPGELPDGAETTSLRAETGDVDRGALARRLVEEFHSLQGEPDDVLPAWRRRAATLGRRVRVDTPGGDVVGEAVDVAFPGALVVDTPEGRVQVTAGDCEHLRPAGQ